MNVQAGFVTLAILLIARCYRTRTTERIWLRTFAQILLRKTSYMPRMLSETGKNIMQTHSEAKHISGNEKRRTSFKVALVSFLFKTDMEKNLLSIVDVVKYAHREGCALVCFPECALSGLPSEDYKTDIKLATGIPGETTDKIGHLAKTYNIYIAIGLLEKAGMKLYDTAVLFDDTGRIMLKYQRINPQWHSRKNPPENLYVEGTDFNTCLTPFGKIAFAICGDMFDDEVVKMIKEVKPDYLIVPMSRSFGEDCQDKEQWEKEEKWVYARQVAKVSVTTLLVNAFETGEDGSFGGSLIISQDGGIIAETGIGQPYTLISELPASYNSG